VVYVELATMDWLEVTVLAVVFLVDNIRVDRLVACLGIDALTLILAAK
jgi:hypothetical protein